MGVWQHSCTLSSNHKQMALDMPGLSELAGCRFPSDCFNIVGLLQRMTYTGILLAQQLPLHKPGTVRLVPRS